jgi:hypothetical protein
MEEAMTWRAPCAGRTSAWSPSGGLARVPGSILRVISETGMAARPPGRVFIWGSFVTAKPSPKDLDILLIMDDDFDVDSIAGEIAHRIRRLLGSIFHRKRLLDLWLETYQTSLEPLNAVLWN